MLHDPSKPFIPASQSLPEITVKAVILACLLTVVLGAANAYLALKIGTTVSASIPAAVISMAVLSWFRRANILENSIVQTAASSGEALVAGISFTLPALLTLHFWSTFDYWQTVAVAILGGTLGILFSIPLRRVLINDKTLPYPEGLAIATVLKASADKTLSLKPLLTGGAVGGFIAFMQSGFEIFSDSFATWWTNANASTLFTFGVGFSPAILAAGYIVGLYVAVASLVGFLIAWVIALPILSHEVVNTGMSLAAYGMFIWKTKIRYIGVGTMLIGGLWTFLMLIKPLFVGMRSSVAHRKSIHLSGENLIRTERDIPLRWQMIMIAFLIIPLAFLLDKNLIATGLMLPHGVFVSAVTTGVIVCLIAGFITAAICAYVVGLVGSTNAPISGITLAILLITSLIYLVVFKNVLDFTDPAQLLHAAAYVIFITAIVATIGGISNDTMQDFKSGQLVGSTPWKQQIMLIVGVIAASFVIPEILKLLFNAYGMAGILPRADMDPTKMLAAPQATLMAAVVQGVFSHQLPWGLILTGVGIGAAAIIIDEFLKPRNFRLPVLGIGLGIYLPYDITAALVLGGFLSHFAHRKAKKVHTAEQYRLNNQNAIMLACGIVAGASLMGVILAIPFVIMQSSDALKIMPDSVTWLADILGAFSALWLLHWMYRTMTKD